jgi:hypothetical protein
MSDDKSFSLVNLGEISKPADTLIKKVSKAVGGIFAPYQIKRIAKAEAEAALIGVQSKIQITDLTRRAMGRWIDEETRHQQNIEDITTKALPQLKAESDPSAMEDDWITNFFDKSRIVSDREMQNLWSRVLAGEANTPGTYSKRTVNSLSDLDKNDAELLSKLCGFAWLVGDNLTPLIFAHNAAIYNEQGINFVTLQHLESIGLIQFNHVGGFNWLNLPRHLTVHYYGDVLLLEMPAESDNQLPLGKALLTKIGQELAPICGSTAVDGFRDFVRDQWKEYLPKPQPKPADSSNAPSPDASPLSTI